MPELLGVSSVPDRQDDPASVFEVLELAYARVANLRYAKKKMSTGEKQSVNRKKSPTKCQKRPNI